MQRNEIAILLLTVGLAWVFGFFGWDKFVHPLMWQGWMPTSMSAPIWLKLIGAFEIIVACAISIPIHKVRRIGAWIMSAHLVVILLSMAMTQGLLNDIAGRDIGLLTAAIALAIL